MSKPRHHVERVAAALVHGGRETQALTESRTNKAVTASKRNVYLIMVYRGCCDGLDTGTIEEHCLSLPPPALNLLYLM